MIDWDEIKPAIQCKIVTLERKLDEMLMFGGADKYQAAKLQMKIDRLIETHK